MFKIDTFQSCFNILSTSFKTLYISQHILVYVMKIFDYRNMEFEKYNVSYENFI